MAAEVRGRLGFAQQASVQHNLQDWPVSAGPLRQRKAIVFANKLEIPQIILMSGNEQPGMSREQQYSSLLEGGKRAAERLLHGRTFNEMGSDLDWGRNLAESPSIEPCRNDVPGGR